MVFKPLCFSIIFITVFHALGWGPCPLCFSVRVYVCVCVPFFISLPPVLFVPWPYPAGPVLEPSFPPGIYDMSLHAPCTPKGRLKSMIRDLSCVLVLEMAYGWSNNAENAKMPTNRCAQIQVHDFTPSNPWPICPADRRTERQTDVNAWRTWTWQCFTSNSVSQSVSQSHQLSLQQYSHLSPFFCFLGLTLPSFLPSLPPLCPFLLQSAVPLLLLLQFIPSIHSTRRTRLPRAIFCCCCEMLLLLHSMI